MGLGKSKVVHVGVEAGLAGRAAMSRVGDVQVAGTPAEGIAEVVQEACRATEPVGAAAASRTGPVAVIAAAPDPLRLGQVLNTRDPLGSIWDISARL
jgi:hypothetical protein